MSWRSEKLMTRVVEKASTQQKAESPGLWLSSPGELERHNADGHESWGQYIAVLFGLQLALTRNLSNKVRGIFFKEVFARPYCVSLILHACVDVYLLCVQDIIDT